MAVPVLSSFFTNDGFTQSLLSFFKCYDCKSVLCRVNVEICGFVVPFTRAYTL